MKKLLYIGAIVVGLATLNTQEAAAQSQFGIRGGVNFAKEVSSDENTDSRTGLLIGFYASVPLSNNSFFFQPEILYSQKGGTYDANGSEVTEKIDYLEVPLLFKLNIQAAGAVTPHLYAGPYIAYNLNTEIEAEGTSVDVKEFIKDFDFGGTVGAGLDIEQFNIGARYSHGFSNLLDSDYDNGDYEVKNSVISIVAGFTF